MTDSIIEQAELEHSWVMVQSDEELVEAAQLLRNGVGPVGVDAERASGYRYTSQAYLVQCSRADAGTFLFDPTKITDFSVLSDALNGIEWVFHAAISDLQCLAELGLTPGHIFDTEVASRLLNFEKVNLAFVVEHTLGVRLDKAHSAADWSTRPLPKDWLEYAALDVALLPQLRAQLNNLLDEKRKSDFAREEFEAILQRPSLQPLEEPWRKLTTSRQAKDPLTQTIIRELWNSRDQLAKSLDVAPGRLIPDASIVHAAIQNPRSMGQLASDRNFRGRASRNEIRRWWDAIVRAKTAPPPDPLPRDPHQIPHHRNWPNKYPEAATRLTDLRVITQSLSQEHGIPAENLFPPEVIKKLAWNGFDAKDLPSLFELLLKLGARKWQCELCAESFLRYFVENKQL